MLPGMEMLACPEMAVPMDVMRHVVEVESSRNPYAIGVVGGVLARQPRQLDEALATVRMLEQQGYNFSVGLAQVNRYNLAKYGLDSYEKAFQRCPNLQAGSRILAECHRRSGNDWGKSFSCYYSGNFTTGFRHGYVQKVFASIAGERVGGGATAVGVTPINVVSRQSQRRRGDISRHPRGTGEASDVVSARVASPSAAAAAALADGQAAGTDPDRAYERYPSTGAMVRGGLARAGDVALSRGVLEAMDPVVQQPVSIAQPSSAPPAAAQLPGAPVLLRPWSARNPSQAEPAQTDPATAMPAANIPVGDSAFVF
ncbi:type VI secretion protein [Stenotrophomonas pictorum JCM 9942]|jgi:type IV secretion system protein VirB1|uniref:Type VI secretion protein n=1 Tax=Stenotrophomonas pictorum JCM 9942 TaxID=1236960 RepID=A0A0R0A8R2_9GAMM|nr:lytic transglycosylase domain-containing protein [Stenotrophomonas pictorum]KRG41261.1 type VI secretion protein [Stenotrophomonas pictorum JCM 9942]